MIARVLLVAFALCASIVNGQPDPDVDVPLAPITTSSIEGWTNVVILKNPTLQIVVSPAAGRIVGISYKGGENILRLNLELKDRALNGDHGKRWMNYGGDWFWPVAQSRWTSIEKWDLLPPTPLAEEPWAGTAWKNANGTSCCILTCEYGEPIHVKASRLIKLDTESARFSIRQRIERTKPSELPVVLWNISQIGEASRVVMPQDPNSKFEKGVTALLFDMPDHRSLISCDHTFVYETMRGEHKLGSDSKRSWIAAQKGSVVIAKRATSEIIGGTYPDGGCTVVMYSNSELGYSEIGTLSVEKKLLPGESLQNMITIDLLEVRSQLSACELADVICKIFEEKDKAKPTELPSPPQ